mgnify:FL=1|jgi:hypothetical protein|tara:strand:- start:160 stop:528 length:369 start_codon:yes stop_codon:yes gene_type:complete
MSSANYEDITINQGTDISVEIHLVHDSGSTYNLSNHSVAASLKRRYADSANDPFTVQFNAVVVSPSTDGIINLSLTNTQTDAMKPRGRYVYDVEVSYTDSDNNAIIQRVLEGQAEVSPSATK